MIYIHRLIIKKKSWRSPLSVVVLGGGGLSNWLNEISQTGEKREKQKIFSPEEARAIAFF